MLINAAKRDAYTKVVAYLRGKDFQQQMVTTTLRRSINPDVQNVDTPGQAQALVELSFPAKREVVDAILSTFDDTLRLPTDSTFILDQSGSMAGPRIDGLRTAMLGLAGADLSLSGRFVRFHNRERIFLLPFTEKPGSLEGFDMGNDGQSNTKALVDLTNRINNLQADGGTAIYDSLSQAYQQAMLRQHNDPSRFYSLVLMTDGENNAGMSSGQFTEWYKSLSPADKNIKVFAVIFGEADPGELQRIAELTGGRSFDSRKSSLQSIFKEIRGYQ
jgi:Ca-activated chloride channel family protein